MPGGYVENYIATGGEASEQPLLCFGFLANKANAKGFPIFGCKSQEVSLNGSEVPFNGIRAQDMNMGTLVVQILEKLCSIIWEG